MSDRNPEREHGKVKWFDPAKGYGFIQPDAGGKDVFVHVTAVQRAGLDILNDGQAISYVLTIGRNGKEAAEDLSID